MASEFRTPLLNVFNRQGRYAGAVLFRGVQGYEISNAPDLTLFIQCRMTGQWSARKSQFSPLLADQPVLPPLKPFVRFLDTGPRGVGRIPGSLCLSLRTASSSTRFASLATQLVRQASTNVAQRL